MFHCHESIYVIDCVLWLMKKTQPNKENKIKVNILHAHCSLALKISFEFQYLQNDFFCTPKLLNIRRSTYTRPNDAIRVDH